jgi:hypothetical protein
MIDHFARGVALALVAMLADSATSARAATDTAASNESAIVVTGENGTPQRFDAAALSALPVQTVKAEAHGNKVECRGPALIDVLAKVGTPSGEALRGKNLALYVRVSAADGYRAVFSLAELDSGMRDAVPIVTASCNGGPLEAKDGPFRLVVPGEKRPARWVRQVTAIDVLRAP